MNPTTGTRDGGTILVDQLLALDVGVVFCVPGESYLAALEALRAQQDRIRLVVCRSEGGAAAMAAGYARASGRPGVVFVTRGPGATNASIGIHTAYQDSLPVVLLVGQVARSAMGREGFQEIDLPRMFGPLTKWSTTVMDAGRLPELMHRAFHTAMSGRPGPVMLALPEDMLAERVGGEVQDAPAAWTLHPAAPGPDAMREVRGLIAVAERPVMIVGGSWSVDAAHRLREVAEAMSIPVVTSFRCQDLIANSSTAYAGELGFAAPESLMRRVAEADLLITVGARLGEVTSDGYRLPSAASRGTPLVHVYPDAAEIGSVHWPALGIVSDSATFLEALPLDEPGSPSRREWMRTLHREWSIASDPRSASSDRQYIPIMEELRRQLPADAMISMGAGNYTVWARRFMSYDQYPSEFGPTSGAMGFGLPAGIGATFAYPARPAIVFAGDGCLMMTVEELMTAVSHDADITILLFNNGRYGTIRSHQDRAYPGRPYGTDLQNPDFAALARSCGARGWTVTDAGDFSEILAEALRTRGPGLIELRL